MGAGDITVSSPPAAERAPAVQGQIAQRAAPPDAAVMGCDAAACREVTYKLELHLAPPILVGGAEFGCAPTPTPEQQQDLEAQVLARLRRWFPDRPATCPDGEHCVCEFDSEVTHVFERTIPGATYQTPTAATLPIGWCAYAVSGTVTITRATRTGACEPSPAALREAF